MSESVAAEAVARAVRESYGRLVAILSARLRDVAAAEDALSDALLAAWQQWPVEGVPNSPESWLLAVARRRVADQARRAGVAERAEPELSYMASLADETADAEALPDRRADLLFACADPAIDASVHTPLMLQVVLGLDAAQVASAYLASPAAMAQRLVRAKQKIRDAGIAFRVPEPAERRERLDAVLEALYGAFGTAWSAVEGGAPSSATWSQVLRDEVVHLARVLVQAIPDEPEPKGLLALMSYVRARDDGRRDAEGRYVPLGEQDPARWDHTALSDAERLLFEAAAQGRPGRFQLEAAIQSAHVSVAFGRARDDQSIVALYDGLVALAPTVGAYVNRAAAIARAHGLDAGMAALEALPAEAVRTYQPYWALRAHLLQQLGVPAPEEIARAAALTEDAAVRAWLLR